MEVLNVNSRIHIGSRKGTGDLWYDVPWRNLAFFYAGYRYSRGLIRFGRLDDGFQLKTRLPRLLKGGLT